MSEMLFEQQRELQAAICGAPGMPDTVGLAVYREAYTARLIAALRDNYLVLHRAMGDEPFDSLARAYIAAHPSPHRSIRWFGDRLAKFMATQPLPHEALVDLARMDWALRAAFDGPDDVPIDAAALHALRPEQWPSLVFRLHGCVQLLPLAWAVEPAWRALRAHDPESGDAAPELPAPEAAAHALLVWRQSLETHWRTLAPHEAELLGAVAAGSNFEAICALAAKSAAEDDPAAVVVGLLQRWLADGLLTAVLVQDPAS
ncbi:DNA-binding domain-containing protein [Paucibacter sp. R3-3]|uniref:DNA-binding domain-containing protein n=1 Tax=Roseateles agri TaxID=3098619 RepID=A0ABU5DF34_9BURK|nr:DNA-binding domain-containing protein [Paucibacter sp. R3-3]MDY0744880.1 DNA-binding domain-containing protein [Paucibacter sp. R3-3]